MLVSYSLALTCRPLFKAAPISGNAATNRRISHTPPTATAMGAQQSIDTLTQLVDPYSVLDSAQPAEAPHKAAPLTPSSSSAAVRRPAPAASASTSHISVTIDDDDEIEINAPRAPASPSAPVQAPEDLFDDPVDRVMSRIAPPAVVAILASPESSASELPMLNPRAQ